MIISFPLNWFKWMLWCVVISRLWRGTLHKTVITPPVTCNSTCSFLVTSMVCWLKLSSQPESHNFPIDMRELCSSPGNFWASLASSIKVVVSSLNQLVDWRIYPFGYFNLIGATGCMCMSFGAFFFRYCPDSPVSDMVDVFLWDVYVGNKEYRLFTSLLFLSPSPCVIFQPRYQPWCFVVLLVFGGLPLYHCMFY